MSSAKLLFTALTELVRGVTSVTALSPLTPLNYLSPKNDSGSRNFPNPISGRYKLYIVTSARARFGVLFAHPCAFRDALCAPVPARARFGVLFAHPCAPVRVSAVYALK